MLFNSYEFAVFFVIVYGLYLFADHKWQNRLLLAASYYFYGSWDWRFLSLIVASTLIDYVCGLKIAASADAAIRKRFLAVSVICNLSFLGFFKYFNFFAETFQALLDGIGLTANPVLLNIILPVGISFYTFQTMSYTIDIYRGQLEPTRNLRDFALFVAFFPQLVAGPIERAKRLLPQVTQKRTLKMETFGEGVFLIYWGLFQKIFVADNLAKIVDPVFAESGARNGVVVLIATYAFAFQIFCDFAGYSNIARGVSKCLGFDIMVNFNLPYFSKNPSEFWRRWHISLSTWLRDYLYIPLGGNRNGTWQTYRNLMLTMLLGGLWHGAGWTFVVWGGYQGLLLVAHRWFKSIADRLPLRKRRFQNKVTDICKIILFFQFVCIGWVFFRAQSLDQALAMIASIFTQFEVAPGLGLRYMLQTFLFFTSILLMVQLLQYWKKDLMVLYKIPMPALGLVSGVLFSLMVQYAMPGHSFIYFQF
jgi:D-alanyl-lipoteichoic acid acyltransferase DltB (MBOAT superfamily)